MAFNVHHEPPYATVLGAAQAAGEGEFRKERFRQDLALTELAQRDLAQQRAIAAQQQSQAQGQAFAAQQAALGRRQQMGMAGWEAALRQQGIIQQRQWNVADNVLQEENLRERMGMGFDAQGARNDLEFDRAWMLDGVEAAEKGTGAELGDLTKQAQNMTPEGRRMLGDLTGKFRSIQRARSSMTPEGYSEALSQFADEMATTNVRQHIQEPPTAAAEYQKRFFKAPDGNGFILQPNGEMRPVPPPKQDTGATSAAAKLKEQRTFVEKWLGKPKETGKFDADGEPITSTYGAKDILEMFEIEQEALMLIADKNAPVVFNDEEVQDLPIGARFRDPSGQLYEKNAVGAKLVREQPSETTKSDTVSPKQARPEAAPANDPTMGSSAIGWEGPRRAATKSSLLDSYSQKMAENVPPNEWNAMEAEWERRVPYGSQREAEWESLHDRWQRGVSESSDGRPSFDLDTEVRKLLGRWDQEDGAAQSTATSLTDLQPQDAEAAQLYLPQPKSKADRDKLPPGTRYLAPDGSIWIKR